ncbi:hypothetical protein Agub_g106 [Astrephomene gubernaculifera]|uniref:Proteasome assembly chaperone 1 n=1 Tax=Astrephomene gubernaculifera TaxID=47775 RepID=A0AAD3DDA4_9CHLO|nr:hypothetical protein Agub_g106 [Astrephomene gubernaculifera]
MDIFEQADAFTPSRAVLQEEEEAAAPSASNYLSPAVCVWNKALVQQLYPEGFSCDTLVVATCPTSCALVRSLPGKQLIGSVLAPGVSLAGNSLASCSSQAEPLPSDRVCCVYALPPAAASSQQPSTASLEAPQQGQQQQQASAVGPGAGGKGVLLVCCQYEVPRERAAAWARAVLGQLSYGHAVFLGSMAAEQFRGFGDASQEVLLFSLRTRGAQQAPHQQQPPPLLPTGTVVGGLPAALLSHCQVRGRSAELFVLVEMVLEGRAALMAALAGAVGAVLRSRGAGGAAELLGSRGVLAAARRELGLGGPVSDVYV